MKKQNESPKKLRNIYLLKGTFFETLINLNAKASFTDAELPVTDFVCPQNEVL